jgi:cell cycle sensor histidine kinase DivJ
MVGGRLIGLLLAAPLLFAGAIAQTGPAHFSLSVSLAMICALAGLSWCGALIVTSTAGTARAMKIAFAILAAVAALVVVLGGGPGTPFAVLLAVPAIEAWWLRGSRACLRFGLIASGFAALAALGAGALTGIEAPAPSVWHWLVPALYGASLWLRRGWLDTEATEPQEAAEAGQDPQAAIDHDGVVAEASGGEDWQTLVGRPLADSINVGDRVALLCAMAKVRESHAGATVELRLNSSRQGPSGRFLVSLSAASGGRLTASFRDIAELVALREELAVAREAARENEHTKSRFLATMSHELRTPLNAIIGFSEVLEHEMLGKFADPRQKEYVELIRQSGGHLLSIVNSILDVSKIEAGTYTLYPERFALDEVVQLAVSMVATQATAKSIHVEARVDKSVGDVFLDRRAVLQMVINLLSNAVKFTQREGRVSVLASRQGDRVTLSVQDTGIGIAACDLGRIGRPFVQVENDYSRHHDGTGLGLSLVKGLVGLHKGGMAIESAPGEGTTVTLTFDTPPQAEIRPINTHQQATTNGDRETKKHEVLRKTA